MKKLSTGGATDELSMKPLPRGQSISLIDRYLRRITCGGGLAMLYARWPWSKDLPRRRARLVL